MAWVNQTFQTGGLGRWRNGYGTASALPLTSYEPDFLSMADPANEAEEAFIESRLREGYYQKLGWNKGTAGAPEVQEAVRRFWMEQGARGVIWLLARVHDEHSVDVLAAVAEIAGDVGREDLGRHEGMPRRPGSPAFRGARGRCTHRAPLDDHALGFIPPRPAPRVD